MSSSTTSQHSPSDEQQVQALKVQLLDLVDNLQQLAVTNSAQVMDKQVEQETTKLLGRYELQCRLLQEENDRLKAAVIARESQMARMFADVCKAQYSATNKTADHETLAEALQQIAFKAFKTLDQSMVPNQPSVMTPLVVDATLHNNNTPSASEDSSVIGSDGSGSETPSLASLSPPPQSPMLAASRLGSAIWAGVQSTKPDLDAHQLGIITEFQHKQSPPLAALRSS